MVYIGEPCQCSTKSHGGRYVVSWGTPWDTGDRREGDALGWGRAGYPWLW